MRVIWLARQCAWIATLLLLGGAQIHAAEKLSGVLGKPQCGGIIGTGVNEAKNGSSLKTTHAWKIKDRVIDITTKEWGKESVALRGVNAKRRTARSSTLAWIAMADRRSEGEPSARTVARFLNLSSQVATVARIAPAPASPPRSGQVESHHRAAAARHDHVDPGNADALATPTPHRASCQAWVPWARSGFRCWRSGSFVWLDENP